VTKLAAALKGDQRDLEWWLGILTIGLVCLSLPFLYVLTIYWLGLWLGSWW
jgi:hypothetical protein